MNEVMQGWHDFFMAEVGAAAALAGLLFVAISINLARILKYPHLPMRAAESLLTLLLVLLVGTLALVPGLSAAAYGWEIASAGFVAWIFLTVAFVLKRRVNLKYSRLLTRALVNQLPPLPFVVGGALLACGRPEGLYWMVPGVILCFTAGVFGAWVLLIEIQR
jgi:hypothetical protein